MEKIPLQRDQENENLEKRIEQLYTELVKRVEIVEACNLLEKLPTHVRYHVRDHTLDVIRETVLFAVTDGLSESIITQQAIAAAWHDVGYIENPPIKDSAGMSTEALAIGLFKQSATYLLLSEADRNEVIKNITDTEILFENNVPRAVQKQSTYGYILDGDLSNLGRTDFFAKRSLLAEELGIDLTDTEAKKKFYARTFKLIKNHEWKTPAARQLRQEQKEQNIHLAEAEYIREFGEKPHV